MLLRGVHLRLLDRMLDKKELELLANLGIIEKTSLVLSRKKNFEIFFAGTDEMHQSWLSQFRKCCILHNFAINYKLLRVLNNASTSTIYEAVSLENQQFFAIKVFDKEKLMKRISSENKENRVYLSIENEINILKSCDCENLLSLKEIFDGKKTINLVLDEMRGGDLYQKLLNNNFEKLKENDAKLIIRQLLQGIRHMHSKEIMHRDIKPENIFFMKSGELFGCKLGDFGLAEYAKKKDHLFKRCGTPGYVAPEVLLNEAYNKKCDLFSVGIILYVL